MDHRPGAGRNAFHDSSTGRLWVPELLAKAQSAGFAIRITKARLDLAARVRIRFRTRVPRYQLSNPKRECKEQGQSNRFHSNFLRELKKHRTRLVRKLEAIRGDLAEARRAGEYRRAGEALLAYLHLVPKRVAVASLPDPADHTRRIGVAIDPKVKPQVNAAHYFKRAAKAERGLNEIPPRLRALEGEVESLGHVIERADSELAAVASSCVPSALRPETSRELDEAFDRLPPNARREAGVAPPQSGAKAATEPPAAGATRVR